MIGIIDYGMGNLMSVKNVLDYLGEDNFICTSSDDLEQADRIILPGIGGFPDCIKFLQNRGYISQLDRLVIQEQRPILGICLGMQAMAKTGLEFELTRGLGWFDATVVNINTVNNSIKIPNVGWEEVYFNKQSPLFKRLPSKPDFYLVHSYYMQFSDENSSEIEAYYEAGGTKITAAVRRGNIFGTQFHPEKSSDFGMSILENFIDC